MSEHTDVRATGGCLCGAVRYEVRGPLRDVLVCHCNRCRRSHGHFVAYAACQVDDLELLSSGTLRWFDQDGRSRGFCRTCGSSLFWRAEERDTVSIAAGTIDEPTGLTTVAQIYTADRGDYYALPHEGEQFPADRPG